MQQNPHKSNTNNTQERLKKELDGLSEISIFSRSTSKFNERTKNMIDKLKSDTTCKVNLYDLEDESRLRHEISESAILTNGTSVGMAPDIDSSIINDITMFHKDLIVSDIIYNPRETKLMKLAKEEARRIGRNVVGTEMFLLGIIGEGSSVASEVLSDLEITMKDARFVVESLVGYGNEYFDKEIVFTRRAKRVLEKAWISAKKNNKQKRRF